MDLTECCVFCGKALPKQSVQVVSHQGTSAGRICGHHAVQYLDMVGYLIVWSQEGLTG